MSATSNAFTATDYLTPKQLEPVSFEYEGREGYVARLTAYELDIMQRQEVEFKDRQMYLAAFYFCFVVCNELGERFFSSGEGDKVSDEFRAKMLLVAKQPVTFLVSVGQQFATANKLTVADLEELSGNLPEMKVDDG